MAKWWSELVWAWMDVPLCLQWGDFYFLVPLCVVSTSPTLISHNPQCFMRQVHICFQLSHAYLGSLHIKAKWLRSGRNFPRGLINLRCLCSCSRHFSVFCKTYSLRSVQLPQGFSFPSHLYLSFCSLLWMCFKHLKESSFYSSNQNVPVTWNLVGGFGYFGLHSFSVGMTSRPSFWHLMVSHMAYPFAFCRIALQPATSEWGCRYFLNCIVSIWWNLSDN